MKNGKEYYRMRENHWYNSAKTGVFLHWGVENGKTAEEFENERKDWTPKEWIMAAKKLHASYITYATFHSDFSYIVSWKTKIPGLNTTKRDFLGELIKEANEAGIKIIVYITSTPPAFKSNCEKCIDYEAFKRYKGLKELSPDSFLQFQRVIGKEIILELMDNYPDVAGFWYDGWNDKAVCEDIFGEVHKKNPDAVNIRNNFYKDIYENEDVAAQECLRKIYLPEYDKVSASWLESDITSEWCNVPFGQWDTVGNNIPVPCDNVQEIKHLVSILSNGLVSKIGLPPYPDGKFDSFVYPYLEKMDDFLTWSEEAFENTKSGGFIAGSQNCGAYCFTTQNEKNDEYYICVTSAPYGTRCLTLVNNGFYIDEVINLKTGNRVDFFYDENTFNINSDWSEVETYGTVIFKIKARKKERLLSVEINSEEQLPSAIVIGLEENTQYCGLEITHSEKSSVSSGGWGYQSSQRPKCYALYDNISGTLLQKGAFLNQRGKKWISLNEITSDELRLEIISGYDTKENHYAEAWIGGWQMRLPNVKSISSDSKNIIRYINSNNELIEKNGCYERKIADDMKKVICGANDKFYYIDVRNKIVGIDEDIKAIDITVDENGRLYYINEKKEVRIKGSDKIIVKNAKSISASKIGVLYIVADKTYKYTDGSLEEYKMPYNAVKIAAYDDACVVLTPTGKMHYVSFDGENSYIMGYDGCDITIGNNRLIWSVSSIRKGRLNIKNISLVKK